MQKNTRQKNTARQTARRTSQDEALAKQRLDLELDRQLEGTFPASDALKITLRQAKRPLKWTPKVGAKR
jgi:hypothetical protein